MKKIADASSNVTRKKNMNGFLRVLFSRKINIAAFCGLMIFVILAVFAEVIAPYDPNEANFLMRLKDSSPQYLLGTDTFGRDIFSRIIFGARVSLLVGVLSVLVGGCIGVVIGMISAYLKGFVDELVMRFCEAFRAIPQIVISIILVAILGNSMWDMILIMGITTVPSYIRMMRASALRVDHEDYLLAARLQGASSLRVMFHHLLPNSISPIIVMMTQAVGFTIIAESGLSFLGLGISIPTASWGTMLNDAKAYLLTKPVYAVAPGIAITLLVLCTNILGDGIRDALDPRLRNVI